VITLDLEMPRLDGFAFLRLLMASKPRPVIVISAYSERDNVFRALELGALDFVAKPTARISPEIAAVKDDVVRKVLLAGRMAPASVVRLPSLPPWAPTSSGVFPVLDPASLRDPSADVPASSRVIAMAASTGGPATLTRIFTALPGDLPVGIVVAQHMPIPFTTTFAKRLDKQCPMSVREVTSMELVREGHIYIAPGNKNVELSTTPRGVFVKAVTPSGNERYTPSADVLFSSAAKALRRNSMAIVLTGMGDDGSLGAFDVAHMGGKVYVESSETAVIDGMPRAVVKAGVACEKIRADEVVSVIQAFARR
jgi:two-component system chemotaxis response regulator CheB